MIITSPQGLPVSLGYFSHEETAVTDDTEHFCALIESGDGSTESDFQTTLPFSIRIVKIEIRITANTKSNDFFLVFRDDGVSVASLTVTANNGAELVTSPDLDIIVDAGSLIDLMRDTSDSSSGTLTYTSVLFWYETL